MSRSPRLILFPSRTGQARLTAALISSCVAGVLLSSSLDAAPPVSLRDGWQICALEPAARNGAPEAQAGSQGRPNDEPTPVCLREAEGPHWIPIDPNRGRRLYFRIDRATEGWLRVALPPMPDCQEPAVYFGVVNLSFIAYLEGGEIYRFGEPGLGARGFAGRPFHLIPLPATRPESIIPAAEGDGPQNRWLTLRIWSDFRNFGIDGGVPVVGCRAEMQKQIVREDISRLLIGGFAMLVGLAGFVLFARSPRETVYLAFALLGCNVSLYMIGNRSMRLQLLLFEEPLFWHYIEHFSLYFLPANAAFFFQQLAAGSRSARVLAVSTMVFATGFTICSLFFLPAYKVYGALLYSMLAHAAFFFYVAPHALYRGPPEVRIMVVGVVLFFIHGLGDVFWALGLARWWPGPLAQYGFLLLILSMSVTIWRRYVRIEDDLRAAHEALHVYAQHLESLVEQRTSELQFSLDEVSRLKEQQDGDYLLISRILSPMTSTTIDGEVIRVDSLIAQHKRFEYRGMNGELGGDLCMAETLELDGERYVAWMNADAMGKSVQGASGAIVLAVAFRAFLHLSVDGQIPISGRPPVEWLLRLTEELQRVFRPFEGRMMVSLTLGLLNEKSGKMFAINAGHPPSVLLRAGTASYVLENSHDPIGSASEDFDFSERPEAGSDQASHQDRPPIAFSPESAIIEMQLLSGDVLIAGSDGRDDLRRKDESGRVSIESDPKRFIKIVADAGGDLDRIAKILEASGQRVDDLSLIRLAYGG
ncbi:MAG: SpoIIE family protein phosphatase [Leptospirales bacterium]